MQEISLDRSSTDDLVNLELDKDTWIYTYGSAKLQEVRSFGYECEERYLTERLKLEYAGFKINRRSSADKLDFPPLYAVRESLQWSGAYVAKQITDGEVIAIDRYLGKYQIIKKTHKPWYLVYRHLANYDPSFYGTAIGCAIGMIIWAVVLIYL
jgi:hypothetical protein